MVQKKNKRREAAFVFLAPLMSKQTAKQAGKRESAGLRVYEKYECRKISDAKRKETIIWIYRIYAKNWIV